MEYQHLVQKYTFDVGFDSESKSFEFQNRLAAYIKEKLIDLTDDVFTEKSGDRDLGIDKLSIDLGSFPLENFDDEFYSLFKSKLSEKLNSLLAGRGVSSPEEHLEYISRHKSNLKILEYFLLQGILPWSAAKNDSIFSVRELILLCTEEKPMQVKALISSLALKKEIRLRMIRQFEDTNLWVILELWNDADIKKIKNFYADLVQIFVKKPLFKNYFSEFRELIWEFILQEIIVFAKYSYEDKVWVEGFIAFISEEINMPVEAVISTFYSSVNEKNPLTGTIKYKTFFLKVTSDLMKKNKLHISKKHKNITALHNINGDKIEFEEFREEQIRNRRDYLLYFLKVGHFNFNKDGYQLQPDQIIKAEKIIKEFIDINPAVLKKVFTEGYFDIENYTSQQILLLMSQEVRELVLNKIFKIDNIQFEVLRRKISLKAFVALLETGHFPYSVLPLYFKKTELDKFLVGIYIKEKEVINEIIKKALSKKINNNFKILEIKKYLSVKTFNLFFSDFLYLTPESLLISEKSIVIRKGKGKIVKLEDFKTQESIINVIQLWMKDKSLPVKANFTISEVITKFISLFKEAALVYFASITEKEIQFVKKAVSPSLANIITQRRDELAKAVKEIKQIKEIKKMLSPLQETLPKNEDPVYNFKDPVIDEPIYINNAGLVIFHPYLTRFFNMLQLLDKKAFKDEYSAHKAVYLLQYLANKGLNSEEHELVLNKLLCGINLKIPLIRNIEITEEDKNICESLIEGVISNWPILKKTSNDNFRASFIMREGRLLLTPKDWSLKVEERGYDILVEKLPWSISMIKLAWMKNMINVAWK